MAKFVLATIANNGRLSGRLRTTTKILGPLNAGIESSRLSTSERNAGTEVVVAAREFVELRGLSAALAGLRA